MSFPSRPILFPIASKDLRSPGLITALKLAILHKTTLVITLLMDGVIQPGVPVREKGTIVAVKPVQANQVVDARKKLTELCEDLMITYPLLENCIGEIREGFVEREFLKIVKEINPLWTVWSNSSGQDPLQDLIYNLAAGTAPNKVYPILIISESQFFFPPNTIQFYASTNWLQENSIDPLMEMRNLFHSRIQIIEVIEHVTPHDFKKANEREQSLKHQYLTTNLLFTRVSKEDFHFQIHANHSGNQNFIVLNHEDQELLEKVVNGRTTKSVLESTYNPILIL